MNFLYILEIVNIRIVKSKLNAKERKNRKIYVKKKKKMKMKIYYIKNFWKKYVL